MLSSSLFSSFFLVRLKLGSGFPTGHGWFFALSEGTSCCVCFWVPLVLSNHCGALPRPTKICLALFAASALRLAFSAASLRRSWVSGFGWPEARCFALSLSLSLVSGCLFLFWSFGAATLFLMPRPLLG